MIVWILWAADLCRFGTIWFQSKGGPRLFNRQSKVWRVPFAKLELKYRF